MPTAGKDSTTTDSTPLHTPPPSVGVFQGGREGGKDARTHARRGRGVRDGRGGGGGGGERERERENAIFNGLIDY
jgi:hypothetical protein